MIRIPGLQTTLIERLALGKRAASDSQYSTCYVHKYRLIDCYIYGEVSRNLEIVGLNGYFTGTRY